MPILAADLLHVDHVSAGYGRLQILNDVTVEARPGEITVIVGPNGSGKSTLLKTIAGIAKIYQGTVFVDEKKISGLPAHEIARLGVAYLPQTEMTFTRLTVGENLRMGAYTIKQGDFADSLKRVLTVFPNLSSYMSTKVANLSGGERQMVAMAMALLRRPRIMMFDEPTANLAPIIATQVLETISELSKDSDMTILLVEQNALRALQIGQYAYLLVNGEVWYKGTTQDLLKHKELGKLYLGLKPAESGSLSNTKSQESQGTDASGSHSEGLGKGPTG